MKMNETDLLILEYGKKFQDRPLDIYGLIEDHRRLRKLNEAIERAYKQSDKEVEEKAKVLLKEIGCTCGAYV